MTNEQIILQHSLLLMEEGIIGTTGKTFEVKDIDGNIRTIREPEPIHTFAAWRDRGYQVRQGEKAIAKFPIWRHQSARKRKNRKTGEEENTSGKMYLADAFFFSFSQVKKIEEPIL